MRFIVQFVSENQGCSLGDIFDHFQQRDGRELHDLVVQAHEAGLIDAGLGRKKGDALRFGNMEITDTGKRWLERTQTHFRG